MRSIPGDSCVQGRRQVYFLMAVVIGALLLLGGPAPQAMSQTGEPDNPEKRMPDTELSRLEEREAKLDRSSAQAPPERRVDEDAEGNPYVAGELIVTYKEQASDADETAANREAEARVKDDIPKIDAAVLTVPEVKSEPNEAARERDLELKKRALEADPSVEAVDYNYLAKKLATANDPLFGQQWGLQRIQAPAAWDRARGAGAAIAIVDGGAQPTHPDLNGAFVDEWDYYNNDATADDEDGHGTHVAGIAAAYTNDATGIAGTAPDAPLFNYDVCGATSCPDSAIATAVMDAADMGADVINMSLGGPGNPAALENAVNYAWNKGVVVVAAAGNEATSTPSYPAAYPNVIAVSGVDYYNGDSDFSNFGSWVDVAAPGGESGAPDSQKILSSVPTYIDPSGYDAWNGTSMASPFVAGVAALLDSQGLTAAQTRQRIEGTATDLGATGKDSLFGYGLVNARAAVGAPAPPPDSARPQGTVVINGGRASTASRTVTLKLRASDPSPGSGVSSMRLKNAGGAWTGWLAYSTSKSWRLSAGAGTKTVYVQYRDRADNTSLVALDRISYRP